MILINFRYHRKWLQIRVEINVPLKCEKVNFLSVNKNIFLAPMNAATKIVFSLRQAIIFISIIFLHQFHWLIVAPKWCV